MTDITLTATAPAMGIGMRSMMPERLIAFNGALALRRLDTAVRFPLTPNYGMAMTAMAQGQPGCRPHADLLPLDQWTTDAPWLARVGLIFHASRCGSTLLSRLLGAIDGVGFWFRPWTEWADPHPLQQRHAGGVSLTNLS